MARAAIHRQQATTVFEEWQHSRAATGAQWPSMVAPVTRARVDCRADAMQKKAAGPPLGNPAACLR